MVISWVHSVMMVFTASLLRVGGHVYCSPLSLYLLYTLHLSYVAPFNPPPPQSPLSPSLWSFMYVYFPGSANKNLLCSQIVYMKIYVGRNLDIRFSCWSWKMSQKENNTSSNASEFSDVDDIISFLMLNDIERWRTTDVKSNRGRLLQMNKYVASIFCIFYGGDHPALSPKISRQRLIARHFPLRASYISYSWKRGLAHPTVMFLL